MSITYYSAEDEQDNGLDFVEWLEAQSEERIALVHYEAARTLGLSDTPSTYDVAAAAFCDLALVRLKIMYLTDITDAMIDQGYGSYSVQEGGRLVFVLNDAGVACLDNEVVDLD